jgi:hypothetical protein
VKTIFESGLIFVISKRIISGNFEKRGKNNLAWRYGGGY